MTVLDIGANNGFFSFEAERRGARRVLATDLWSGERGRNVKAGFDLARRVLNSKVDDKAIDVLGTSPDTIGIFDLVLFLGVLYHARHPLLALERVFSVTGKQLILETHVSLLRGKRPAMEFYPGTELQNDATNWWGPNRAAVEAMLKTVGFRKVELVWQSSLARRVGQAIVFQIQNYAPFLQVVEGCRMVFHAWR